MAGATRWVRAAEPDSGERTRLRTSLSPALGVIAFYSNRAGNDDLYVMAADGSELKPLAREPAREYGPLR